MLVLSACASSQPSRSAELQAQIDQIKDSFASYDGDFEAVAESAGYDPSAVITRSMLGNADALHDLFMMSQAGLDAASAQGYVAYLSRVFLTVGDAKFGDRLLNEPESVQDEVRFFLCHEVGHMLAIEQFDENAIGIFHQYYPITFPIGSIEPTN